MAGEFAPPRAALPLGLTLGLHLLLVMLWLEHSTPPVHDEGAARRWSRC